MGKIIASTYEIIDIIGKGGNGIVYMANHLNLNKRVILKADKRKSSTKPELLRREVDVLKNLKSPYIPQVYDYLIDGDTVYTVMEYVDGQSLDVPLSRGITFSQPQVIRWTVQLLRALRYLHSPTHGNPPRGFVHSDIKPANIMVRAGGDISLIDFNVSLALGEEYVIGLTKGYASPEQYRIMSATQATHTPILSVDAYVPGQSSSGEQVQASQAETAETTVLPSSVAGSQSSASQDSPGAADPASPALSHAAPGSAAQNSGSSSAQAGSSTQKTSPGSSTEPSDDRQKPKYKRFYPDARSDIYSVGATMYHLLSGRIPHENAYQVTPLSKTQFSPQIVDIVAKAMQPEMENRYQSAQEMLDALLHLRTNDSRYKRQKFAGALSFGCAGVLLAAGIFSTFTGLSRMRTKEEWLKLSEYSQTQYASGDIKGALELALQASPSRTSLFMPASLPQAQLALTQAAGVYQTSDGYMPFRNIPLPSQPLFVRVSPDSSSIACMCLGRLLIIDPAAGEIVREFDAAGSALSEVEYVRDGVIAFAAADGLTVYDLAADKALWKGDMTTAIAVSADGNVIAGIYRDEPGCTLYNAGSGRVLRRIDFGGRYQPVDALDIGINPQDNLLALNADGTKLGVSLDSSIIRVYDTADDGSTDDPIEIYDDGVRFTHFEGGFSGDAFFFIGSDDRRGELMILDAQSAQVLYRRADFGRMHSYVDEDGIWLGRDNRILKYNPDTRDIENFAAVSSSISRFARSGRNMVAVTDDAVCSFDEYGVMTSRAERPAGAARAAGVTAGAGYAGSAAGAGASGTDLADISGDYAVLGNVNSSSLMIMKHRDNSDAVCALYDPDCVHVESRLSTDGNTLVLLSPASIGIFDALGDQKADVALPSPDQIYDQQVLRGDGAEAIQITYLDGTIDTYDFATGEKLSSDRGAAPDPTLFETLETEHYRIDSDLHGGAVICDRQSGRERSTITEDAYLTYAYEADDFLILQFTTDDLQQYGCILDSDFNKLADLPGLCDVIGNRLYFDCKDGTIRQTQILSRQEIINRAQAQLEEMQ